MKLIELQQTFDDMTRQLKDLTGCYPNDRESVQYKMLWDDRVEIKQRLNRLLDTKTVCCGKPFVDEGLVYCSQCGDDGRGIE